MGLGCRVSGLGLALVALAFPAQAGQGGKSLFPTGQGSRWSFKGKAGTQELSMEAVITSSKTAGGKTTVLMRWTLNGQPVQDETYIVTASGVSRAKSGAGGSVSVSPPVQVIKNPMVVGKSWTWKGTISPGAQTIAANATLKVGAREAVKSAAGTFNAFRVDMVLNFSVQGRAFKIPNSYWFAPGAGLVRQRASVGPTTIDATVTKLQVK